MATAVKKTSGTPGSRVGRQRQADASVEPMRRPASSCRSRRWAGTLASMACSLWLAVSTANAEPLRSASDFAAISDTKARAEAMFQEVGKVLQHPRCLNCHPSADRPSQGEGMRPHQPAVARGADGHGVAGLPCMACHGASNYPVTAAFSMPGHHDWHLAPIGMAWQGKSLREICLQISDRNRNGGKSMQQIVDHMATDSLVGWGWQPGVGRSAAPGSQQQFGELFKAWVDAGAHCPRG